MQPYSTSDVFSALLFPNQHSSRTEYLQTQLTSLQQMPVHNQMQQQWIQMAQTDLQQALSFDAVTTARAIREEYGVSSEIALYIPVVHTLEDLQQANPYMQTFIMALPELREYYAQGRVSGYEGVYVDTQPGVIGWKHEAFQIATDGLLLEEHDSGELAINEYHNLLEEQPKLDIFQQADIQHAWDVMRAHLAYGEDDPTSVTGGLIN
jgi:hypothetical protein